MAETPSNFGNCTDLNLLCYNSVTGQGQLLWVGVYLARQFGWRFSLVSINLGIWFYGVEMGDAGDTLEPEERRKIRGFPIKLRKQSGDVVQLVRTLLSNRRIDVSKLSISNLRHLASDRPVTVTPTFPAFPEVGVHANIRFRTERRPPRTGLCRPCSIARTKEDAGTRSLFHDRRGRFHALGGCLLSAGPARRPFGTHVSGAGSPGC